MSLRFPAVPADPFWSSDSEAVRRALVAVEQWRTTLATWLGSAERDDSLSPGLATTLRELLGALPTSDFVRFPYRLAKFPAALDDPNAALRAVLLWRAGIVDFLSDVWDTLGEADFDIEECRRAATFFAPEGADALCPLCLSPQGDRHYDACAVQLAWRDG